MVSRLSRFGQPNPPKGLQKAAKDKAVAILRKKRKAAEKDVKRSIPGTSARVAWFRARITSIQSPEKPQETVARDPDGPAKAAEGQVKM